MTASGRPVAASESTKQPVDVGQAELPGCRDSPPTHLIPTASALARYAGIAWMKASSRGWTPIFGGISTRAVPLRAKGGVEDLDDLAAGQPDGLHVRARQVADALARPFAQPRLAPLARALLVHTRRRPLQPARAVRARVRARRARGARSPGRRTWRSRPGAPGFAFWQFDPPPEDELGAIWAPGAAASARRGERGRGRRDLRPAATPRLRCRSCARRSTSGGPTSCCVTRTSTPRRSRPSSAASPHARVAVGLVSSEELGARHRGGAGRRDPAGARAWRRTRRRRAARLAVPQHVPARSRRGRPAGHPPLPRPRLGRAAAASSRTGGRAATASRSST